MRNPANWQVYAQGSQPAMIYGGRGYTGHEHLNQFGIINMNARLYDPLLARFLAPDPFVNSGMTNDFNRYVYCRDNPMMYTDPSGKSLWSWLKRNVVDPFSREWNHVFGNGFTVSFGTNTQFSSANAVIAPNGANGTPYGPGVGIQTNNWKTVSPVYANYQDGFFSTQPVNFESNLQKTVVQAENSAREEDADWRNGEKQNGLDFAAFAMGTIDFNYNMWVDGLYNASKGTVALGNRLTGLSTILGGLQVYDQYTNGGIKNINPVDGTSVAAGMLVWTSKAISWLGFGGEFTSLIGNAASEVAYPIAIFQSWYNVYKPMNDLRFAPSYRDQNGEPVYGNPTEDDWR